MVRNNTADPIGRDLLDKILNEVEKAKDEIERARQQEQMRIIQMQHKENTIRNLGKALMSYIESNAIG